VTRMAANVALDTLLGSVPVLGDLFDVTWKSNRRNYELLQRSGDPRRGPQTWRDWLFLLGLLLAAMALLALPLVLLVWLIRVLRG